MAVTTRGERVSKKYMRPPNAMLGPAEISITKDPALTSRWTF